MLKPSLLVQTLACRQSDDGTSWRTCWRLDNPTGEPIVVEESWLPHSMFRADAEKLDPPAELEPGEGVLLEREVACPERLGAVVENAFLFLRLRWRDQPWRLLARHRVTFNDDGTARLRCAVVTVQPVGFSRR